MSGVVFVRGGEGNGNIVYATTDHRLMVDITAGNIIVSPSTAIYAGAIALTSDAAQFTAQACNEVVIQNDPDNVVDILIGTSGALIFQMSPGDSIPLAIENLNLVYGKTVSSTATVNWLGRR